jgi:succinyl-CoA synthetase alpha subunit
MLQSQSKSRLVGANAPGIISAIGRCRIGFQPLPTFTPGHVGIVAKSGTLSYETVGSLTRAGVGQSLCIAVGGDVIAGTNFVDALKVFEHDDDTEAIIIVGELGGTTEEEAADWITDYRKRVKEPKPIAAVVGGFQAPPGKVMGHAGAWVGLGEGTADSKSRALENAGVTIVDHPAKFGGAMKEILAKSGGNTRKTVSSVSPMDETQTLSLDRSNQRFNSVAPTTLQAFQAGLL